MAIKFEDLPDSVRKKAKLHAKTTGDGSIRRTRISADLIKRHALAIDAILLDERALTTNEARRILHKAIKLLR